MIYLLNTFSIFSLPFLLPTLTAASCTRLHLTNLTSALLSAQTSSLSSSPSFTSLLSPNLTYTENRHVRALSQSILSNPLTIAHARSQHDTAACATYSEFVVTQGPGQYVLGVQMRVGGQGDAGKIERVDSIVTTKGDWLFNVSATAYWIGQETWGEIPEPKRDTRETIKAAADAYCDVFSNKNVKVPWGTPCARLEGGMYTGKGRSDDRCDVGIPSGVSLVNREYVIDEVYGTVDVMMDFAGEPGQVGKKGLPDSHEFRVEGGKLRYVHTLTSCGGKACM